MNLDIARLKTSASDPDLSPDVRDASREQLLTIAGRSYDPRSEDAKLALTEILNEPRPADDSDNLLDVDLPTAIASFQAKQRALYEGEYKAEGLTGSGCVARVWKDGGIALNYSLIQADVQTCEKADKSALFRYHLVTLYGHFRQTPDYDWPARELAEATFSKYLPYEWLTRDLFEAMADMELHIKLDLAGNSMDPSLKSHPCLERVREIKNKFPDSYGLIPDAVNNVVHCLMHG